MAQNRDRQRQDGDGAATNGTNGTASAERVIPRLKTRYLEEVRPALVTELKYNNTMQAPKLEKIVVNIGMWLERFVIIATSLHRDFLPSSWAMYYPTFWDFAMFAGTIGLFLTLLFLFLRFLPVINIFEMRELLHEVEAHGHH